MKNGETKLKNIQMENRIKELMAMELNTRWKAMIHEPEEVIKEVRKLEREERDRNIIEYWKTLEPFKDVNDIPSLPKPLEQFHLDKLVECGAIAKKDLKIGQYYYGKCRNNDVAMWIGDEFKYQRFKFGQYYTDAINHFEDDNGFDLFVPIRETEPEENDIIKD